MVFNSKIEQAVMCLSKDVDLDLVIKGVIPKIEQDKLNAIKELNGFWKSKKKLFFPNNMYNNVLDLDKLNLADITDLHSFSDRKYLFQYDGISLNQFLTKGELINRFQTSFQFEKIPADGLLHTPQFFTNKIVRSIDHILKDELHCKYDSVSKAFYPLIFVKGDKGFYYGLYKQNRNYYLPQVEYYVPLEKVNGVFELPANIKIQIQNNLNSSGKVITPELIVPVYNEIMK